MSTSKVIKSIKTDTQNWIVIDKSSNGITFALKNSHWRFTRVSLNCGGGYLLKNRQENVIMIWEEGDTIASQLWGYFLDYLLS